MRRFLLAAGALATLTLAGLLVVTPSSADAPKTAAPAPARTVPDFTLTDTADKAWKLADFQKGKATVVLFLGTECPVNNAYMPRLAELHKRYQDKGVAFVAVNANAQDTPLKIAAHVKEHKLPFPVLRDPGNKVADLFGAKKTPEAFVLDPKGTVAYQGRIDDMIGIGFKRKAPTRDDLVQAVEEVLAGKPVSVPTTAVAGCFIQRALPVKDTGKVTFTKDVSRILQARCQECHRPGQIAPMPLLTYEDAAAWSETIKDVLDDRRMPPWHADPKFGKFSNDRTLPDAERQALLAWIKDGCPKGDPKDLPPAKEFAEGWIIGKPDAVFTMKDEYNVPAEGGAKGISYKHFLVKTDFDEDRWVRAAEAKPGARDVVHHIIVYVVDKDRQPGRGPDGIGNGWLAAYAPGDMPAIYEPGLAKKLPKGATLVFQMHYTPNGVAAKDRSSVGLIFTKEPPKVEVRTRGIAQQVLAIPPGDNNYKAKSVTTFKETVDLISLLPHMHLRGKDFLYEAVYPDGKRETLLSVPKYDFNWQSNYRLVKPLRLPAGTKIECTAHFDNSAGNPNNPDPKKLVFWGDQTWEEMLIGFVDYAVVNEK